jgi:ring-1,2-phenylacetyl-CoA epoxidase subunit PaaC
MRNDIYKYILQLADNSLIMGHRLSEWTGHGPVLEQDIAITNIALDLVGQSRYFYQHAALLKNDGSTEDSLAYLRDVSEFKNILMLELPNGDWAKTILKVFFFSSYQYFFYKELIHSLDKQLASIAEKSLKEVTYHLRWSSEWVIRLGDGTDESHRRMMNALDELWNYTGEMFVAADYELQTVNDKIGVDINLLKDDWNKKIKEVFEEATLTVPQAKWMQSGGKSGIHTEHLGYILTEMQFLQRAYPGCEW